MNKNNLPIKKLNTNNLKKLDTFISIFLNELNFQSATKTQDPIKISTSQFKNKNIKQNEIKKFIKIINKSSNIYPKEKVLIFYNLKPSSFKNGGSVNISFSSKCFTELNKLKNKINKLLKTNNTIIRFDKDKSRLLVNRQIIKIEKFSDQYHVLKIIFNNKEKLDNELFYSEIDEKINKSQNHKDKKYYNALYQIKKKLEKKNADDFLDLTIQSVKVNTNYLP